MFNCIDYSKFEKGSNLKDMRIKRCMSRYHLFLPQIHSWTGRYQIDTNNSGYQRMAVGPTLLLWLFCFVWMVKMVSYIYDVRKLFEMHQFYHHLLDIPDVTLPYNENQKLVFTGRQYSLLTWITMIYRWICRQYNGRMSSKSWWLWETQTR